MYIERELEKSIRKYIRKKEILVITGMRQSGKTTLVQHIQKSIKGSIFLTFEDVDIRHLFDHAVKDFIRVYIDPYDLIFIDEFQYSTAGGKNLKYIYDTKPGKKIIITGSSAPELTVQAIKYLAGRVFVFELYPLTFNEFIKYKSPDLWTAITAIKNKSATSELSALVQPYMEEFMIYGGYPRVALASDKEEKKTILKNIYQTYLLKDIASIAAIADDYKFAKLIKLLAVQTGNITVYNELSVSSEIPFIDLKKYLNFIDKSYVAKFISPFFTNKRTEIVKNQKIFFCDTGLRNAVIGDFRKLHDRTDKGALLENFHFCQFIKANKTLKYYRSKSGAEVDFIIEKPEGIEAIEIKSNISQASITRALHSFNEKYNPAGITVFNNSICFKQDKIKFRFHWQNIW